MTTLFISDLHLDATRPQVTEGFLRFLADRAADADALYILGDLFEAWVGDDDDAEPGPTVARALATLDIPVFFVHGNRDFLLGAAFADRAGVRLLDEETVIDLPGGPTLIMHGDHLCTDDVDYQAFRQKARNPAWQAQILALPLPQRRVMAAQLREMSREATGQKAEDITDVNPAAVLEAFQRHGVKRMIHGHTHRPAIHEVPLPGGGSAQRIVLGDWFDQGSVLVCGNEGVRLEGFKF